ncbi:MAG: hypothetical protein KG075_09600 [Alphaproteobacteria bacterium]|nr:hypothetical protein [Alphaproteobacteria bacterium]
MRILFVTIFTLGLLVGIGRTHAAPACSQGTAEALVADLKAEVPEAEVVLYVGPEAKKMVDQYNAAPPASAFTGDAVTVVIHPQAPVMVVIIEQKGCVVEAGLFPVNNMRLPPPARGKGI